MKIVFCSEEGKKVFRLFGKEYVLRLFCEECSELMSVLLRSYRAEREVKIVDIQEEIADVFILVDDIAMILSGETRYEILTILEGRNPYDNDIVKKELIYDLSHCCIYILGEIYENYFNEYDEEFYREDEQLNELICEIIRLMVANLVRYKDIVSNDFQKVYERKLEKRLAQIQEKEKGKTSISII